MSTKSLSGEQLLAIYHEHAAAEFAQDIERTMQTVADHPIFEWPALNLRIEGRDAVRKMYSEILSRTVHTHVLSERAAATGENVVVAEYVLSVHHDDGSVTSTGVIAVLEFQGDKIWSERTYTHPDFTELLRKGLGEDFENFPGVTQLDYNSLLAQCTPVSWGSATTRN